MFKHNLNEEELNSILEKIDPTMSISEIIKEIMGSWSKSGKIGGSNISSKKEALEKAIAISYSVKKR
jgi:hypothetical protein